VVNDSPLIVGNILILIDQLFDFISGYSLRHRQYYII